MANTVPKKNVEIEPRFNFAYLDEQTKRSIRRAILKISDGWGRGIQVTASVIGNEDTLNIINNSILDIVKKISS